MKIISSFILLTFTNFLIVFTDSKVFENEESKQRIDFGKKDQESEEGEREEGSFY